MLEKAGQAAIRQLSLIAILAAPTMVQAQEAADLAKKLSNPIADLVSVPFQFNWEQGVGPNAGTRFILNVQPVVPFTLSKNLNLIARVIVPLVGQPALTEGGAAASGVSDVLASFFLSPSNSGGLTWGVGPVFSLPSTAEPTLGTGKWSTGLTFVALKQTGGWTVGALWNQIWSVAGASDRADVSQMFLQPFVAYTTPTLWTITLQSESTVNWEAEEDQWTVPVNLIFSKLLSFGPLPASYFIGAGVFPVAPETGPDWKLRSGMTILLPRKR